MNLDIIGLALIAAILATMENLVTARIAARRWRKQRSISNDNCDFGNTYYRFFWNYWLFESKVKEKRHGKNGGIGLPQM